MNSFSENLEEIKKAIQSKSGEKLNNIFSSTRKLRKEIIKAGQVMDVTQEHYEWLEENGYGKEEKKTKKTKEKASDKKQEIE